MLKQGEWACKKCWMQHIFRSLKESPGNDFVCVCGPGDEGFYKPIPFLLSSTSAHYCHPHLYLCIAEKCWVHPTSPEERPKHLGSCPSALEPSESIFRQLAFSVLSAKFYKENWVLWRTQSAHLHFPSQAETAVALLQRILSWKVSKAVIISIPEYISF